MKKRTQMIGACFNGDEENKTDAAATQEIKKPDGAPEETQKPDVPAPT